MKLPDVQLGNDDYRLNGDPFFFKFQRREQSGGVRVRAPDSFVVARNHLLKILNSNKTLGKNGGRIMDFESLNGLYLRHGEMVGLLRSGYIGTYPVEHEKMSDFISRATKREKGIVLAWRNEITNVKK